MGDNGPHKWWIDMPPVSRAWLTSAVVSTLAMKFGALNPMLFAFDTNLIWNHFQIWRFVTCFLIFGNVSINFLIQMMMLYQYSPALERNPFPAGTGTGVNSHEGNIADFIWMLTVVGIALQGIGYLMGIRFLAAGLLSAVIYLWSKRNPKAQTSFWGARFDGMWLPWILIGFKLITGDDITIDLMGIAAGHCYYFVKDVLPGMETPLKGKNVLATPSPIYRWLGVEPTYLPPALQRMAAANARGYGAGPNAQPGPMPRAWGGAGRVLGRD